MSGRRGPGMLLPLPLQGKAREPAGEDAMIGSAPVHAAIDLPPAVGKLSRVPGKQPWVKTPT